jgi:hypothetical protein
MAPCNNFQAVPRCARSRVASCKHWYTPCHGGVAAPDGGAAWSNASEGGGARSLGAGGSSRRCCARAPGGMRGRLGVNHGGGGMWKSAALKRLAGCIPSCSRRVAAVWAASRAASPCGPDQMAGRTASPGVPARCRTLNRSAASATTSSVEGVRPHPQLAGTTSPPGGGSSRYNCILPGPAARPPLAVCAQGRPGSHEITRAGWAAAGATGRGGHARL